MMMTTIAMRGVGVGVLRWFSIKDGACWAGEEGGTCLGSFHRGVEGAAWWFSLWGCCGGWWKEGSARRMVREGEGWLRGSALQGEWQGRGEGGWGEGTGFQL